MKKSSLLVPTVLALGTAVFSGVNTFVGKIGVTAVKNPVVFTTLKNALVGVVLVGGLIAWRRWREIQKLSAKQWLKLVAIAVIGGSIPFALFFTGLAHTTAINAGLIRNTLFLWVALLAIPLLKERLAYWQWIGIGAVAAANLFIGGFTGFKYNSGEMMILASTVLWAVEYVIAKNALKDISSLTVSAARMVLGSVLLIGYVFWLSKAGLATHLTSVQWGWTLLSAGLLTGYVITWYAALKRAPATYVATLLVLATLITNVLSSIYITHKFPVEQVVSGGLIAVGIAMIVLFPRRAASTLPTETART